MQGSLIDRKIDIEIENCNRVFVPWDTFLIFPFP